jgi:hypothetical protein
MRVGADVGQLLGLGGIHVHVAVPRVLAHDHALVDLLLAADEQLRLIARHWSACALRA